MNDLRELGDRLTPTRTWHRRLTPTRAWPARAILGALAVPLVTALAIATPRAALAQRLQGVVRDSASGRPVPGAIVILLDSAGTPMTRNLTDDAGQYRATILPAGRRVRVLRLGFRPRELPIPAAPDAGVPNAGAPNAAANGGRRLDVTLQSLPFLLAAVRVEAPRDCPRRSDRAAAWALLEQARAGLLATVVARSEVPARMVRLRYERLLSDDGRSILRQTVRIDSTAASLSSFGAIASGRELVRDGFMRDSAGGQVFLGPDAEVLLDDGFASGYCFHVMPRDAARPNEIGLGFRPARRRNGRVEIDGALWIDTVARALTDIDYRYIGLGSRVEQLRPGGRVGFREVGNGVALVDRWSLRLVGATLDSSMIRASDGTTRPMPAASLYVQDGGGELARVTWPGGRAWDASLGTLRLRATRANGTVAASVMFRLDDTDYQARTDGTGDAEVTRLVPGPYAVTIVDPRLAAIDVTIPTPLRFVAERGVTAERTVLAPTAEEFVAARCVADRRAAPGDSLYVVGRVLTAAGEPVRGVAVTLSEQVGAVRRPLAPSYTTGSDGLFQFCGGRLRRDIQLGVRAYRARSEPVELTHAVDRNLVVIRVPFAPPR